MKDTAPPAWLDRLLCLLLSSGRRETISGDLHEEFVEDKLPRLGRSRATRWYARQVLSFVPGSFAAFVLKGSALALLCFFSMLAGSWLGFMDVVLGHPASHVFIAGLIVCQALVTLGAIRLPQAKLLRWTATLGSVGILWLASIALRAMIASVDVEGYILLIALALIAQAVLTMVTFSRPRRLPPKHV